MPHQQKRKSVCGAGAGQTDWPANASSIKRLAGHRSHARLHEQQLELFLPIDVISQMAAAHSLSTGDGQAALEIACRLQQQPGNELLVGTSTGKELLVLELLALHHVLNKSEDCLIVLPYRKEAEAVAKRLKPFSQKHGFVVKLYAGTKTQTPVPKLLTKRQTIYVSTIELGHSIFVSLLIQSRLRELGLLLVHRLDLVSDDIRGYRLETLVSKFQLVTKPAIRIIGHTIPLVDKSVGHMLSFLSADSVFHMDSRSGSQAIKTLIKRGNKLLDATPVMSGDVAYEDMPVIKSYGEDKETEEEDVMGIYNFLDDGGLIIDLVIESLETKQTCIIFSPTKDSSQSLAEGLIYCLRDGVPQFPEHRQLEREALTTKLQVRDRVGYGPSLQDMVRKGIAYHNSNLSPSELSHIQNAFKSGVLSVMVCTSALWQSVNLPADRVIVYPEIGYRTPLNQEQFQVMSSRAKKDVVLVWDKRVGEGIRNLVEHPLPVCGGHLMQEDRILEFILMVLNMKLVSDQEQVVQVVMNKTISGPHVGEDHVRDSVEAAISYLLEHEVLTGSPDEGLMTTGVGDGVARSQLALKPCLSMYHQLKSVEPPVSHLFLTYFLVSFLDQQTWLLSSRSLRTAMERLDDEETMAARSFGLEMQGKAEDGDEMGPRICCPEGFKSEARCLTTLILNEMIKSKRDIKHWGQRFGQKGPALSKIKNQAGIKANSMLRFMQQTDLHPQFRSVCRDLCSGLSSTPVADEPVKLKIKPHVQKDVIDLTLDSE